MKAVNVTKVLASFSFTGNNVRKKESAMNIHLYVFALKPWYSYNLGETLHTKQTANVI